MAIISILYLNTTWAQEIDISEQANTINEQIETLAEENEDENADYTELIGHLEYFRKHPLNLNKVSAEELKQLVVLNDIQIANFIMHRKQFGKLISIYELQAIDGFTLDVIDKVRPFISVKEHDGRRHFSMKEMFAYGEHQFFARHQRILEEQKGFSNVENAEFPENQNLGYKGSPDKIYSRYRFNYYNNVSCGFTAEKDAGEEFFKGSQKNGFDFYSAHFHLKNFGTLKALSLGDYSVQLGQGLNTWSALAFGKSSEAINIKKNPQGIVPYRSVEENQFYRGSATTVALKKVEVTAFYSNKKIDANIAKQDSLSKEAPYVTSLQNTGFHRTSSELEDKDAIKEEIIGSNINYKNSNFNIGVTAIQTKFGSDIIKTPNNYNQFEFKGSENSNIGADYNLLYKNINFFGEFSKSRNRGIAYLNGILISLHHHLAVSLLHRHYDPYFHGLMSNGFSENTRTINENGIYTGLEFKRSKQWKFTAYADHFKFPWLKFRTSAPSLGYEYFAQLYYTPQKKLEMYIRYKQEGKEINSSNSEIIKNIENKLKKNARFNIKYKLSESLSLKNRIEWVGYKEESKDKDNGYLMIQDIKFKPQRKPFYVIVRYAFFDTDTYNSRIYAYENDVLYSYSIPAYFYKGSKYYFLIRYKLCKNIDFWIKYAHTTYNNQDIVGSRLDQINGNSKSEVKMQMRIKL